MYRAGVERPPAPKPRIYFVSDLEGRRCSPPTGVPQGTAQAVRRRTTTYARHRGVCRRLSRALTSHQPGPGACFEIHACPSTSRLCLVSANGGIQLTVVPSVFVVGLACLLGFLCKHLLSDASCARAVCHLHPPRPAPASRQYHLPIFFALTVGAPGHAMAAQGCWAKLGCNGSEAAVQPQADLEAAQQGERTSSAENSCVLRSPLRCSPNRMGFFSLRNCCAYS